MYAAALRSPGKKRVPCVALFFSLIALNVSFTPASSQTIYRCDQRGKTVFSDKPCGRASNVQQGPTFPQTDSRVYSTAPVSASPYGEWRGQAQYQATIGRDIDPKAHTVTDLTISIDPQGKVVGASPGNGCKLLGVASPGSVKTILYLDVTFSGCQYSAFNRRYSGTFALYLSDPHVALSLTSLITFPARLRVLT